MKNLVKQWQGLVPNRTPNGFAANASNIPPASLPTPSTSSLPTSSTSSLPTPSTLLPARVTQHPTRSRTQVQQLLSTVKRGPQPPPPSSAAQQAAAAVVTHTTTLSNSTGHPPSPPPDSSKPSPPSSDSLSKNDFPTLTLSFPLNSYRQPSAPDTVNSLVVRLPRQHLGMDNSVTTSSQGSPWRGKKATDTTQTTSPQGSPWRGKKATDTTQTTSPQGSPWRGKKATDTTQPLCLLVSIDTSLLPGNNSQTVNRMAPLSLELDSQTPVDVIPGVDGCFGQDGIWYDWTRHIPSQDLSVTVLPYVYIDGLET